MPLDKVAAISQMTFTNACSWIKNSNFTEVCSRRCNQQKVSFGSPVRRQAITWINTEPAQRRMYASSIGPDNGSVPARRQAIIWTNEDSLLMYLCVLCAVMNISEQMKQFTRRMKGFNSHII